jgi:HK97 family phage major capsid protein
VQLFAAKKLLQDQLAAAREAAANHDNQGYANNMAGAANTQREISRLEANNSIRGMQGTDGSLLTDGEDTRTRSGRPALGAAYAKALHHFIATRGIEMSPELGDGADGWGGFRLPTGGFSAALNEGTGSSGGFAVPLTVSDQIVPLAPQEMAVRSLAQVIPTTMDIKIPTKSTFSTASAKAETSSFTESEPTIGQFTLSAFMAGVLQEISWELAQDVPAFQAFAVDDMLLAQAMYEENLFVNGTGSGQAQGLVGNVGAGITAEPDSSGNMVSIAGILNLIGTLNEIYHANASFLMQRPTSIVLRKAQMESNLFFPAFQSIGGQDYLFGYPVKYSAYMPAATRGSSPVIFGDFKRGYLIGDRGGSGVNVKVLDQPLAAQGIVQLLAYRRTDGRVRRSEAIQQYSISAS